VIITIILLCIAGFAAAFVDSIAGGGGLISLPAFMAAGIPMHFALGTNKFSATAAACTSSIKYARSGKVNFKFLRYLLPFTFIGAALGVKAALMLDSKYLRPLVLVLVLAVGIYSLFSKTIGQEDKFKELTKKNIFLGIILAFVIGFYDGFFGPGTGTFLIFGLISIFGFNFINAGGNARVMNFVSNLTALVLFALQGKIDYLYGIPVAIAMIFGARLGTIFALKKGSKFIKPIFITMSLAVACKLLFDLAVGK
jgi:uncharacterized membrane protein YfcA